MFLNIAMQMKDQFYKLGTRTWNDLCISGILDDRRRHKFIPSTGVTLPTCELRRKFLLSSMIIFAVIPGIVYLRQDEGEINASKSRKNRQNRKKDNRFENADIEKLS